MLAALVVVLVAFIWLGRWQWHSYESSATSGRQESAPTAPIQRLTRPGILLTADAVDRRVRMNGAYDRAHQLFVPARDRNGRAGVLVVTPLRTPQGVVAVLRG